MGDPSSAVPAMHGLSIEAVEWLPVRGGERSRPRPRGPFRARPLHPLMVRVEGRDHRFDSLPDARLGRDRPCPGAAPYLRAVWRPIRRRKGAVGGRRASRSARDDARVDAPRSRCQPPAGGQVIDRAVLAEHRARRLGGGTGPRGSRGAAGGRGAGAALDGARAPALRGNRGARRVRGPGGRAASPPRLWEALLSAALSSAATLRAQAGEWQRQLRAAEAARTERYGAPDHTRPSTRR